MGRFLAVASFHNNPDEHINRTFENILNQTHQDWLLIVGDDFSDDPEFKRRLKRKVVEINDPRIIYYQVGERRELYLYQNMFRHYQYDYYFDLDTDDSIDPNLFEIYSNHFEQHPEVFSIFSDYTLVDDRTGNLLQWSLVQEPENWLEEWNFRHTGEFWEIYSNKNTQAGYGCGRAMRRPEVKNLPIVKECKTATDTFFLFYNLSRGKHLHIPRNLYTYKRREGSDSGKLTEQEAEDFNLNSQQFFNSYTNPGKVGIYDDIWHITSAISTCEWLNEVTTFSLISEELLEDQKNKLKLIYPDKNILFNDTYENVIVAWTKEPSIKLPEYTRLSILTFNDANGTQTNSSELEANSKNTMEGVNRWANSNGNWYNFFRQNRLTHNKTANKGLVVSTTTKIHITFENGPKVEILGDDKKEYFVEFIDSRNDEVLHSTTIQNNMWTKCSKEYFIPWTVKIDGKEVHRFDVKSKKVKISFDSKSVGDTLAWMPQVVEFKNKYKCKVVVSSYHNEWFQGLPVYKDIEFIAPNTPYPAYAHYNVGWFKNNNEWDEGSKNPTQANTIPLIQTATDILGLPYKEVNYGINFTPSERPIQGKYICIGPRSTAGLKEWPHENWRKLAKKLHKDGYKVVNISYEGFEGTNIINKKKLSWEETWNYLYHAELFIGLGSGLSWANWSLGKHTLMINNFLPIGYEFTKNLTKLEDASVCSNCWVKKEFTFDPGDWDWCPINQGTEKQHICQKSIETDRVYEEVITILSK